MYFSCPICEQPLYDGHGFHPYSRTVSHIGLCGRLLNASKAQYLDNYFNVRPSSIVSKPVVASRCGHLFHKKCITAYMRLFRTELKSSAVECPCCKCQVILVIHCPIDFKASETCAHKNGREFEVLQTINRELWQQTRTLTMYLQQLEDSLLDVAHGIRLDRSVDELKDAMGNAEGKVRHTLYKLKRADHKAKKAADSLMDLQHRYTRFADNWKLAQRESNTAQNLYARSNEVLNMEMYSNRYFSEPFTR